MTFKDHFSHLATEYARSRPQYPSGLIDFLASVAPRAGLAWEAGCGSGQFTRLLASRLERVSATDASIQQLSHAPALQGVTFHCALAEASALRAESVDLIVAAAAAHWFELPRFYEEVRRVGKRDAIVALITYHNTTVNAEVDTVMQEFHEFLHEGHWPPERRHVDSAYETIGFPFQPIAAPPFEITANWTLPQLLGYVRTWSGVAALVKAGGASKLDEFSSQLERAWGRADAIREVRWPLALKLGRVHK